MDFALFYICNVYLDFNFSELQWILWGFSFFVTVLTAGYYLLIYSPLIVRGRKSLKETLVSENLPPVSIIICAKNELENMQANLPSVLEQNYPQFEIVIVDDQSTDGSAKMLEQLAIRNPRVKVVSNTLKEEASGKKMALTLGVKAASHEILLMTDADCAPVSNLWIQHMVQPYLKDDKVEMVLGLSPAKKGKGLINALIRFDHLRTALSYSGWAKRGVPYMGVGRNLSYKKSLFFKNSGFKSHYTLKSGDDDLFVNEAGNAKNTRVVWSTESQVLTEPKKDLKSWFWQKKRHLTTAERYRFKSKLALGIPYVLNVMFLTALVFLLMEDMFWWALLYLALKCLLFAIFHWRASYYFNSGKVQILAPIFSLFFYVFDPTCLYSNKYIRYQRWK